MKRFYKNYYLLDNGDIAFFDCQKFKTAINTKMETIQKTGEKCSKQMVLESVAEKVSVSISAIKHWSAGRHAPCDLNKISDIACALEVDISYLLGNVYDHEKDADIMNLDMPIRKTHEDMWDSVLAALKKDIPKVAVEIWLSDCEIAIFTKGDIVICASSLFKREIVESRYVAKIKDALYKLYAWSGKITIISK